MDIDQETAERLERKLDVLLERMPVIDALGSILIRRATAAKRTGIDAHTLDQNDNVEKFKEYGHKRTFIEVGDVAVIRRRSTRKKPAKA